MDKEAFKQHLIDLHKAGHGRGSIKSIVGCSNRRINTVLDAYQEEHEYSQEVVDRIVELTKLGTPIKKITAETGYLTRRVDRALREYDAERFPGLTMEEVALKLKEEGLTLSRITNRTGISDPKLYKIFEKHGAEKKVYTPKKVRVAPEGFEEKVVEMYLDGNTIGHIRDTLKFGSEITINKIIIDSGHHTVVCMEERRKERMRASD